MSITKKLLIAAVAVGSVSVAAPASASVLFAGTTQGCFGSGCDPTLDSGTQTYLGLTYHDGQFNQG